MFKHGKDKDVVRAKAFILEDGEGRPRVTLGPDQGGNVVLNFLDKKGNVRLFAGLTPDGTPRLCLQYAGGKGSVQLEANDRLNTAGMVMAGPGGTAQVVLGIARNGSPALALFDGAGNLVFSSGGGPGGQSDDSDDGTPGGFDWDNLLKE